MYDVIVAGAGVAGAAAAYHLARGGARVLLLERERHPRYKCCGGGLTARAAALLPCDVREVAEHTIYGARLSYGLRPGYRLHYAAPIIYLTSRETLDQHLTALARQAGADVQEETAVAGLMQHPDRVTLATSRGELTAAFAIGADGARSVVAQSLGIQPAAQGLGLEARLTSPAYHPDAWEGEVSLDYNVRLPGGYGWVLPKQSYMAVGVGGPLSLHRLLKPYLYQLINRHGLQDYELTSLRGHLMPVRRRGAPLARGRVLLVGDAAALIDYLTGEGLANALQSARLAAEAILGATDPTARYTESVTQGLAPELDAARVYARLVGWAPRPLFQLLGHSPRLQRAVGALVQGRRTYAGVARCHALLRLALRFL